MNMDEENLRLEERVKRLEDIAMFYHRTLNLEELEARRKEAIKRQERRDKEFEEYKNSPTFVRLEEIKVELEKEKDEREQLEKMKNIEDWETSD